ncbi:MAG: hypothetical protein KF726_14620 [Anaerolineae bacterium]|nr:hypothetical protein [Anaerolineae bacterium]
MSNGRFQRLTLLDKLVVPVVCLCLLGWHYYGVALITLFASNKEACELVTATVSPSSSVGTISIKFPQNGARIDADAVAVELDIQGIEIASLGERGNRVALWIEGRAVENLSSTGNRIFITPDLVRSVALSLGEIGLLDVCLVIVDTENNEISNRTGVSFYYAPRGPDELDFSWLGQVCLFGVFGIWTFIVLATHHWGRPKVS